MEGKNQERCKRIGATRPAFSACMLIALHKSGHEATGKCAGSHLDMIRYGCDHMIKARELALNITLNYNNNFAKRTHPGTHFNNTQQL